jgi:adenosine kinase
VTHFGGVAGNIAYNLHLLDEDPLIVASVGSDFGPYAEHLERMGIRRSGIRVFDDVRTAQGFVTTDLDDNQIWAFYVGAMARAHQAETPEGEALSAAIVSSDGKEAMLKRARDCKGRGVPTFVDPSHALPILDAAELRELIDGAAGYIVNDYEWSLTQDKLGCTVEEIVERGGALILTLGEQGSEIHHADGLAKIPVVRAAEVVDPTGCGDAYRAGLLAGRVRGHSWETAGRMGSLMGAYQVAVAGTQNLALDAEAFAARYRSEFGADL